ITNPTADPLKANPHDFKRSSTSDFVDPEKFANYVYNRKSLGNANYGDGYRFRGRGIFQLTGKGNYTEFNQFYKQNYNTNIDILNNPDLLSTNTEIATLSALWFFQKKVLNTVIVDHQTDVEVVTYKINGGNNGIEHRKSLLTKTLEFIKCL
ncbi:MAG: hypothetical protein LPJ98_10295, partial [Cyclobacteriaceae bacterium]|nr:hypothetical protein [Cyclobacteriaceae bacterium]